MQWGLPWGDLKTYFGLGPIPKPIPKLANTFDRYLYLITETTFQRENLVSNSMGYFFRHKRAPKTDFAAKCYRFLDFFWQSNFTIIESYIPQEVEKHEQNLNI